MTLAESQLALAALASLCAGSARRSRSCGDWCGVPPTLIRGFG